MAITQGLSGSGGTLPDTNETDLWIRSVDGGPVPLEWTLKASGADVTFKAYTNAGLTQFIQIPVASGETQTLLSTVHNYWYKLTATGTISSIPAWFPSVVGA